MFIKLDFTPLFFAVILGGLVVAGAGFGVRLLLPQVRLLGTIMMASGVVAALLSGGLLAADKWSSWRKTEESRITTETLAQEREIEDLRLPRGTTVFWTGRYVSSIALAAPAEMLDLKLEGEVTFANVFSTGLVSKYLTTAFLAEDRVIQNIPCKGHLGIEFVDGPEQSVKPHVGRLVRCTLAREWNRYQAGTEIRLEYDGSVQTGTLAVNQIVDGRVCAANSTVTRENGRAFQFTLAQEEVIDGVACKAGGEVHLNRATGMLESAVLAHDGVIDRVPCRGGAAVAFLSKEGRIQLNECTLERSATIHTIQWPAGSLLAGLATPHWYVDLPEKTPVVTAGALRIIGSCRVLLEQDRVRMVRNNYEACAEFGGARFLMISFEEDGSGYGQIAAAGQVDGVSYEAGAAVRFAAVK